MFLPISNWELDYLHLKETTVPIDSKRLADRRKEKKFTQQSIADALGIRQQVYARYESGDRQPSRPRLNRFCELLDCSPDWLLNLTDDPHEYTKLESLSRDEIRLVVSFRAGDIATLSDLFREKFKKELFE